RPERGSLYPAELNLSSRPVTAPAEARDLSPAKPGFTAAPADSRDLSPAKPGFTAAPADSRDLSPAKPGFTAAPADSRDLSPAKPGFTAAPSNTSSRKFELAREVQLLVQLAATRANNLLRNLGSRDITTDSHQE